jgi:hypothetical protein
MSGKTRPELNPVVASVAQNGVTAIRDRAP